MALGRKAPRSREGERIDVKDDYALCAWARHFNVSQNWVKEAVAAVGDRAEVVREHLQRSNPRSMRERPLSH